jgi:hypothetical protein
MREHKTVRYEENKAAGGTINPETRDTSMAVGITLNINDVSKKLMPLQHQHSTLNQTAA